MAHTQNMKCRHSLNVFFVFQEKRSTSRCTQFVEKLKFGFGYTCEVNFTRTKGTTHQTKGEKNVCTSHNALIQEQSANKDRWVDKKCTKNSDLFTVFCAHRVHIKILYVCKSSSLWLSSLSSSS